MTDYVDVPQANALYLEQQQVRAAIDLIDGGGTLTYLTISPASQDPVGLPVMPVSLTITGPVQASTMTALRAQLVARDTAITSELAALGVTNTPAR